VVRVWLGERRDPLARRGSGAKSARVRGAADYLCPGQLRRPRPPPPNSGKPTPIPVEPTIGCDLACARKLCFRDACRSF
jgi:hypothetical protein